jgi:hypothetical protein
MTDLISSDWKELDADNSQPSPNGVQGGYSPSSVAPIIRSIRGATKRFYNQANPIYTSTGAGNAYVLTFEAAPAGYSKGIIYRFWAHATNTGAATLNINQLGTKGIVSQTDGSPLIAGAIVSGRMVEVVYNGTAFELLSLAFTPVQQGGGTNQGSAKISLGMSSGNRLLMQADSTDFGDTFPININGNATTVGGYAPAALPVSTPVQTALDLKANLASPALTGSPTAPTAAQGNNSTQVSTTAYVDTGLQAIIDRFSDPWACQPLGTLIYANMGVSGFVPPSTNKAYKYILLSAGASAYNGTMIIGETISGSEPNLFASGTINLPGSPFHGQPVRLINTERRFLRPGSPGTLQDGQIQSHVHTGTTAESGWHEHELPSSLWSNDPGGNKVPGVQDGYYNQNIGGRRTLGAGQHAHVFTTNATGGDETRVRNIGVNVYMRIL